MRRRPQILLFNPWTHIFTPGQGAETVNSPPWVTPEPPNPFRLSHVNHNPLTTFTTQDFGWRLFFFLGGELFIFNLIKTKPLCCPSHGGASQGVGFGVEQQIAGLLYKRWMFSHQKVCLCLFSQPQCMCQVLLSFNLYIDLSRAQISRGKKGIKQHGANVKCRYCFHAGVAEIPGEGSRN